MAVDATGRKSDQRTTREVLAEYRKLKELKRDLVKEGLVNGDARAEEVVTAVRKLVPPGLFD